MNVMMALVPTVGYIESDWLFYCGLYAHLCSAVSTNPMKCVVVCRDKNVSTPIQLGGHGSREV
jgi:hypothetical protein